MARTSIEEAPNLVVADVIHKKFSAMPASVTVGEVRAWFEESSHRKLAVLADDSGRYAGSLSREDVADGDAAQPATERATAGPTVTPGDSATVGRDLALQTESLRVPVVDADGKLLGVVGVTEDREAFCGTS